MRSAVERRGGGVGAAATAATAHRQDVGPGHLSSGASLDRRGRPAIHLRPPLSPAARHLPRGEARAEFCPFVMK